MAMTKPEQRRKQQIAKVATMLRTAIATRKNVTGAMVMSEIEVSKPTALKILSGARQALAMEGVHSLHEARLATGAAIAPLPAPSDVQREQAMAVGLDMVGTLAEVHGNLQRMRKAAEADLNQIRFILMGGGEGNKMPGQCRLCDATVADMVPIKSTPKELQGRMGVADLGRMYSELTRINKALVDLVGENNDVMEQFYTFRRLDRFMAHTAQAVREVAPEHARAIAARIRQLGNEAGNN